MKGLHMVTWILLIIGGLNWGLAVFGYDIGQYLPGSVVNVVYLLVALSAIYEIFNHKNTCKHCETGAKPMGQM